MKSLKLLLAGAFIGILMMNSGCGGGSDPGQSVEDAQLAKLSKTWKASAVTVNGSSQMVAGQTPNYTGFTLTISGTAGQTANGINYTTAGRPSLSPWPSNGTFKFGTAPNDPATLLIRDDGLLVTYAVTDAQLQITFNYTGAGIAGRVDQVQGNWVMTFVP